MGNILARIQQIATSEGITIGALERKIGASKGVLSRAINNGTDIQSKWLQIIADSYPHYSTSWLLTGRGSMLVQEGKGAEGKQASEQAEEPATATDTQYTQMMNKIIEMAQEIGMLKEQIRQMNIQKDIHATCANTKPIADAG